MHNLREWSPWSLLQRNPARTYTKGPLDFMLYCIDILLPIYRTKNLYRQNSLIGGGPIAGFLCTAKPVRSWKRVRLLFLQGHPPELSKSVKL